MFLRGLSLRVIFLSFRLIILFRKKKKKKKKESLTSIRQRLKSAVSEVNIKTLPGLADHSGWVAFNQAEAENAVLLREQF